MTPIWTIIYRTDLKGARDAVSVSEVKATAALKIVPRITLSRSSVRRSNTGPLLCVWHTLGVCRHILSLEICNVLTYFSLRPVHCVHSQCLK